MTSLLRVALTTLFSVLTAGCLIPVPVPGGSWDDDDGHQYHRRWDDERGDRDGHRGSHRLWDRGRRWDDDREHRDRDNGRDWRRYPR